MDNEQNIFFLIKTYFSTSKMFS